MRALSRPLLFGFRAILLAVILTAAPAGAQTTSRSTLQYDVRGVTQYDPDHLLGFAFQHVEAADRFVTPDRLADAIELIYREDGYMLAETEIIGRADGSTSFVVHEGVISRIEIRGVDASMFSAISGYIQPLVGKAPLRQADFERAIMLAHDLSGLQITTEFSYPDDEDGALLTVNGDMHKQAGSLAIDNPPRELGEAVSIYGTQEFYSVFLPGDMVRLSGSLTSHYRGGGDGYSLSGSGHYRVPLGSNGLYGETFVGNVIGRRDASGKFAETDLRGLEAGAALGYPVVRDLHNYLYLLGELRHSDVGSSGGGIVFNSSVNAASGMVLFGHDDAHGAPTRIGLIGTAGWRDRGLPPGIDDGDDNFWHLRGGMSTSQPLYAIHHDLSLRLDFHGQFTSSRLPSVEEFYLGDRHSMRGYRFAEAAGDSGFSAAAELSYSHEMPGRWIERIREFAFVDVGHIHNNQPSTFELPNVTLASLGAGAEAWFEQGFSLHGWVGLPLVDGTTTRKHSPGLYISLRKTW